jgi:hypothetical protein
MTMTQDKLLDLRQVKNARAIRVAIYDAALLIGGVLLIDKVTGDSTGIALYLTSLFIGGWFVCLIQRYRDWRAISRIEEDILENEIEERLG